MEDVAGQGRTVLFVSHNLAAITQLCTSAILLDAGGIAARGTASDVVTRYLGNTNEGGHVDLGNHRGPASVSGAVFEWAEVLNSDGVVCQDFSIGDDITIAFRLRLSSDRPRTKLAISLRGSDGTPIAHVVDDDSGFALGNDSRTWRVEIGFRDVRLYPGSYRVTLWAVDSANTEVFDHADDCLTFRVVDGGKLTMRPLPRHSAIHLLDSVLGRATF